MAHALTRSPQRFLVVSAHAQNFDIQVAHAFSQTPGANYGQSGPHYGWCYILLYTSVSRRETHTSNSQHCIGCPCTIRRLKQRVRTGRFALLQRVIYCQGRNCRGVDLKKTQKAVGKSSTYTCTRLSQTSAGYRLTSFKWFFLYWMEGIL